MGIKEKKVIEEIKEMLLSFDSEKFYSEYVYNKKKYIASNLLISLLISEILEVEFEYLENISIHTFKDKVRKELLKRYKDTAFKHKVVILFKELDEISNILLTMNNTTFSYHELLTGEVVLDDLKEEFANNSNDDMRYSLKLLSGLEKQTLQRFRDNKSHMTRLIDSGARGNGKQISQEFLTIGYKVDNKSNILHEPVLSCFYTGLDNVDDFYNASIGCRNAVIQATNSVATSGYLNRKLSFGGVDIRLSDQIDCGSKTYLSPLITEKNHKMILNGRYIEVDGELMLVNAKNSKEFIGKRVKLRSPTTCTCNDGICKTCYGTLSRVNDGLYIGLLSATTLAEIFTQALLSTKHLLFAAIFDDDPTLMEYINISHEDNVVTVLKPFKIKVENDGKIFFVIDGEKEVEFRHNFRDLTLPDGVHFKNLEEETEYEFKEGDVIFTNIQNYVCADMTSFLSFLQRVFDKTKNMKEINNYNEYYNYMLEILYKVGTIQSVHVEVILSQMMRVDGNEHLLWRQNQDKDLRILSVMRSNLSNNLFNSILFERVSESIHDLKNYVFKENGIHTKYEKLFTNI